MTLHTSAFGELFGERRGAGREEPAVAERWWETLPALQDTMRDWLRWAAEDGLTVLRVDESSSGLGFELCALGSHGRHPTLRISRRQYVQLARAWPERLRTHPKVARIELLSGQLEIALLQ